MVVQSQMEWLGVTGLRMEDTDEELLTRTPTDAEAFSQFYRRHERSVVGYFVRRTRDSEIAADLTAETFAAVLVSAARFRPEAGSGTAWLFGIARNKLRRLSERSRVEGSARKRLGMEGFRLSDSSLASIESVESDIQVKALLDDIPTEQADAVRGRVVDGDSYSELANRLRCSEAAARQRVSRGLSGLRSRLLKEN